jgi:transposase-like protein
MSCRNGRIRTVKSQTTSEELRGHSYSALTISAINKQLDESLTAFAQRRLDEQFVFLIIDAKYEKVRQAGVARSYAVLVALGID